MAPLRLGGDGLMMGASRGGGSVGHRSGDRSSSITTRDVRMFFAVAIIVSVLLSMRGTDHYHYKLRFNLPSSDAAPRLGFGGGGGRRGAGGDDRADGAVAASRAGGGAEGERVGLTWGTSVGEDSRQRREERRARRQEKRAEATAATEAAAASLAGGDGRKLHPGEGNRVTHTRIFETGSMLRDGKSTLEYAHMGMLEEIPGGASWEGHFRGELRLSS